MSQELSSLNSTSNDVSDIFVGSPSVEEIKKYMMRQKRFLYDFPLCVPDLA